MFYWSYKLTLGPAWCDWSVGVVLIGNKIKAPGSDVVWTLLPSHPPQALPYAGVGVITGAREETQVTLSFVGLFQVCSEDTHWCYFSEHKFNP